MAAVESRDTAHEPAVLVAFNDDIEFQGTPPLPTE
jgi:hypothetical protein